ncbi:3',5'-cyclic-nucleotide phosphodiesterase regA [Rhypophila decipiens]|uniref:Phosphodiesterase n=1 Tax=Rhypophila decipiens TaxID=261697 RepID=A0AAN6YHB3_9PEZI|nr:3',5'-cyclic-nucleotide phosphodiesterase regA [Rhypophila decipiens]
MEHAACNVIYVDRRVSKDRHLKYGVHDLQDFAAEWGHNHIKENLGLLLHVFSEVYLCSTGGACLGQWLEIQDVSMIDFKPTLILIDTPFQEQFVERSRSRDPSPHSLPDEDVENHEEDLYGLALLQRISSESYIRNLSRLVVCVPVIDFPPDTPGQSDSSSDNREEIANEKLPPGASKERRAANRKMLRKCLELGATDVMASPLNAKCVTNLEVHAYRAHRDAVRDQKDLLDVRRGRKRSWVGIPEAKPFAYLREAMVSSLMNGICRTEDEHEKAPLASFKVSVSADKQGEISDAISRWHFCAHNFNDDELVVAAATMFEHALSMPELEPWRIPTDQLHGYLLACRHSYNAFVPYHNFRHVVDVLQATFNFLIHIGALPACPSGDSTTPLPPPQKSPIALFIGPFEALTLLITAIGHDVGHPGVNNGFLVTLNAPLAQLYNDRSVLESFHCAAYSQILRRHWPAAFSDGKMRSLMISSILATDMGLHFDYMKKLTLLQEKLGADKNTDDWDARTVAEQRSLACALLIKCADISNVARKYDAAQLWMHNLADEFSRQASMETELSIPSALMAVPKKDALSLSKSQLSFMGFFAIPLFEAVADILPMLRYCVDELLANQALFKARVEEEEAKAAAASSSAGQNATVPPIPSGPQTETDAAPGDGLSAPSQGLGNGESGDRSTITSPQVPQITVPYQNDDGTTATFDAVADFDRSDPFNVNGFKSQGPSKQRCSETTEGSSVPYGGDWGSQATSATTGQMPLSPSTQGTSFESTESLDRPTSVPVTTITAPESSTIVPESTKGRSEFKIDNRSPDLSSVNSTSPHINGSPKSLEADLDAGDKTLKKKTSRFRINNLSNFFSRKHRSTDPSVASTDTAG